MWVGVRDGARVLGGRGVLFYAVVLESEGSESVAEALMRF